ncbi:MAG: LptA/OstA family protein [Armatimonadota bacterium]
MQRNVWLAIVLTLLAIIIGGWLLSSEHRRIASPPPSPMNFPGDISLRIDQPIIHGISDGEIVWELKADHVDILKGRPVVRMTGLKRVALMNGSHEELSLRADSLEQNTVSKDLTVQGNVQVTGDKLHFQASTVSWNAQQMQLLIPGKTSAQLGEIQVNTGGNARYDVQTSTLSCDNGITLIIQGNTLRAGSALIDVVNQQFTLEKSVVATLAVASMETWMSGHSLPAIPSIPAGVRERYRDYMKHQETRNKAYRFTPRPSPASKGARR